MLISGLGFRVVPSCPCSLLLPGPSGVDRNQCAHHSLGEEDRPFPPWLSLMALTHRRLLSAPLPSLFFASSSAPLRHGLRPVLHLPGSSCAHPLHAPFPRCIRASRLRPFPCVSRCSSDPDPTSHAPPVAPRGPGQQPTHPPRSNLHSVQQQQQQQRLSTNSNADKRKYLLDVLAIRNHGRPTPAPAAPIVPAGPEEVLVFDEWASMKLKQEGSSVGPVIQDMRSSLIQRLTPASPSNLWPARSPSLELPSEQDPLAGIAVRPVVVQRRTKVPEDWDGPGGTVVLIDKPQGDS